MRTSRTILSLLAFALAVALGAASPASAATPTYPATGAQLDGKRIVLQWARGANETSASIEFSHRPETASVGGRFLDLSDWDNLEGTDTAYLVENLPPGRYYWHIFTYASMQSEDAADQYGPISYFDVLAPKPALSAPAPSAATWSIRKARSLVPGILRDEYGKRFTRRRGALRRSCYRLSTKKVRCRVSWDHKRYRYAGTVTMEADPDAPSEPFFDYSIHRKRIKHAGASATNLSTKARFRAAVAAVQDSGDR